jgi:hypothetical protein
MSAEKSWFAFRRCEQRHPSEAGYDLRMDCVLLRLLRSYVMMGKPPSAAPSSGSSGRLQATIEAVGNALGEMELLAR